jgi:hypothetical protein
VFPIRQLRVSSVTFVRLARLSDGARHELPSTHARERPARPALSRVIP